MIPQNEPPKLFYRGSSMKGTFKPGDRLSIEKIPFNQIRQGDLIIFRKTINGQAEFVVHRVHAIETDGLVTRGDNLRGKDCGLVTADNLIGRVVRFDRHEKTLIVGNGFNGRLRAKWLHFRLIMKRLLKRAFRMPYRLLKKSGIVAKIWRPDIKMILFQTPDGPLIKYIHKNHTIANSWVSLNITQIKKPYELVIQNTNSDS